MAVVNVRARVRKADVAKVRRALREVAETAETVLATEAHRTRGRLILLTPKKWTGMTRRSWGVLKRSSGHYQVTNPTKVMYFLEHGTKAHGPITAKALFIPLNRTARHKFARREFESLQHGRDFVWAKRVKGIKAMRIAQREQPKAQKRLGRGMREHVRAKLRKHLG